MNISFTSNITFCGLDIVAPCILWAVQANANFNGNCITLAVLTNVLRDFDIENGKLTFSIGVPPGYLRAISLLVFLFFPQ